MSNQAVAPEAEIQQRLGQLATGYWMTQAMRIAARYDIADYLKKGPQTAEELAEHAKLNSGALRRVLRALSSVGVFREDNMKRFNLTPASEYLCSDHPHTMKYMILMVSGPSYHAWGKFEESVKTGNPCFPLVHGKHIFEYLQENPEDGRNFDLAMNGIHGGETEPMIDAYDFSVFQTVADVGGGNGMTLAAILNRHPHLKGILFDLPQVTEAAAAKLQAAGVADRVQIEGGDFFHGITPGADAYIFRHIIHDWSDEDAVAILRSCREALKLGGKVLLVETIVPEGNDPGFVKWLDLMMLVIGGKERTEEQYGFLFEQAGLKLSKVVSTAAEPSVIEAVAA